MLLPSGNTQGSLFNCIHIRFRHFIIFKVYWCNIVHLCHPQFPDVTNLKIEQPMAGRQPGHVQCQLTWRRENIWISWKKQGLSMHKLIYYTSCTIQSKAIGIDILTYLSLFPLRQMGKKSSLSLIYRTIQSDDASLIWWRRFFNILAFICGKCGIILIYGDTSTFCPRIEIHPSRKQSHLKPAF